MEKFKRSKEYQIGFERGLKDKDASESLLDTISFNRLLNSTSENDRDREQGYRDGLKARVSKKWENI